MQKTLAAELPPGITPEMARQVLAAMGARGGAARVRKGFATIVKRRAREIQSAGGKARAEKYRKLREAAAAAEMGV